MTPEENRAYQRAWKARNREKVRQYNQKYHSSPAVKARMKTTHVQWRINNRQHYNQRIQEWKARNPEKARQLKQNSYYKNVEHYRSYTRNYHAVKKALEELQK